MADKECGCRNIWRGEARATRESKNVRCLQENMKRESYVNRGKKAVHEIVTPIIKKENILGINGKRNPS